MTSLSITQLNSLSFIEAGLFEIMGRDCLQFTDPKQKLGSMVSFKESAVQQWGQQTTRGLLIRAGRAAFYYWMRPVAVDLGWKDADFRLLPSPARIKRSLRDFLAWLEVEKFIKAALTESTEGWKISVDGLTVASARIECNLFLGMLQELACWAGSGKFYPARELECQAGGAEKCVFLIDRQPAG